MFSNTYLADAVFMACGPIASTRSVASDAGGSIPTRLQLD